MEATFISIHDTSPDAITLFCSDSIVDVLGYAPAEVLHTPCWDFFHPDEQPLARQTHDRSIELDKAAVLKYCRMKNKDGGWVGCEIVFTVVYDVIVVCTSIYRRGLKSQSRAADAPAVRRIFSASPRDPRYHMLSHLSSKFTVSPKLQGVNEPRAALFLNRYTRTLTIMYATEGLADILGVSGDDLKGKSFYFCIQERCLGEAVNCLERAKTNNSIAYLRFWFRDPRLGNGGDEGLPSDKADIDSEAIRSSDEEQESERQRDREQSNTSIESQPLSPVDGISTEDTAQPHLIAPERNSRASSGNSNQPHSHEAVFGEPPQNRSSSTSSMGGSPNPGQHAGNASSAPQRDVELEAVISCTSDGLVVCMRKAEPVVIETRDRPAKRPYDTGLFASPWASEPLVPPPNKRPRFSPSNQLVPGPSPTSALRQHVAQATGTPGDFMNTIRDCAVFAWALAGINGSLAEYSSGCPKGEAQPPAGLPVWKPEAEQKNLNTSPPNASPNSHNVENRTPQSSVGRPSNVYQNSTSAPQYTTPTYVQRNQ